MLGSLGYWCVISLQEAELRPLFRVQKAIIVAFTWTLSSQNNSINAKSKLT